MTTRPAENKSRKQQQHTPLHPVVVFFILSLTLSHITTRITTTQAASTDEIADSLFDLIDTDHDGIIQVQDLESALSKLTTASGGGGDGENREMSITDQLVLGIGGKTAKDDSSSSSAASTEKKQLRQPPPPPSRKKSLREEDEEKERLSFTAAFTSSVAMIIATEIGDKTFFIAAVMSMRNDRLAVFGGAILALICMTVLSTMMGLVLPAFLPRQYTHVIGGILFLYFGIKLIFDSRGMEDKVSDELEEVEEELLQKSKKGEEEEESANDNDTDEESKKKTSAPPPPSSTSSWETVFIQSLTLTFVAEWGDRSQIATIALAAAKEPWGVTVGACFGHSLCTGMAVVGGRMLASKISEKTVSLWGGVIFLLFGVHSLFFEA